MKKFMVMVVIIYVLLQSATFAQSEPQDTMIDQKTITGAYSGKQFTLITTFDPDTQDTNKQWFDLSGNRITYKTVRDAEHQAYFTQYGVFDQQLATLLEDKQLIDSIEIAIWLQELTANDIGTTIQDLNNTMGRGYDFIIGQSPPLLQASISKADLLKIQFHPAIDRIYINHRFSTPESLQNSSKASTPDLFSALPTEYIPPIWTQGFRGQGQKIGIIEIGKVQQTPSIVVSAYEPACNNLAFTSHATEVAEVAAGNSVISGVAPHASILSACAVFEADIQTSLDWVFDQGANVANISLTIEGGSGLILADRLVDYVARNRNKFIIVASGNAGGFVGSPAKAYNIITVGGFLDDNSMTWNDDQVWVNSAFRNPVSNANDREKPEVVAVSEISLPSTGPLFGTSYAAPQVTGLGALLIDINDDLAIWPEAIKAIIMASSIHNLEDSTFIPPLRTKDFRDGAGGLVGILAHDIAINHGEPGNWFPCTYSCWWGIEANNNQVPVGGTTGGKIWADAGQRVRVVASWWANAFPAVHYELETDFDLQVKTPDNILMAGSSSTDNNYEMVDFIAPVSGLYRIEVKKYAANENLNKLGIAALVYDPRPYLKNKVFVPYLKKK